MSEFIMTEECQKTMESWPFICFSGITSDTLIFISMTWEIVLTRLLFDEARLIN